MEQTTTAARPGLPARIAATRTFIEGVRAEMRKVTWPTRAELIKATRMIVILALVLGVAIGLVDVLLNLLFVRGVAAIAQ
jgi:preprotein translocase subunit SecE